MGETILLNDLQTPIEELGLENEPKEVQEQFWDFFNSVPYIKYLVSKDRKRACDLPRDEEGKIIVDVTEPHILEDMDYFRPTAIHYQKYQRFTDLKPNGNPNSEYSRWAKEEARRCREGMIRPSDGEWITGDYYYFLNYCPILQSKNDSETKNEIEGITQVKKKIKRSGKRKSNRVPDFPKVWDGHYLKFHYIEQARNNGNHGAELASRGKGKSYSGAAMLGKRFELGESEEVRREVQCVVTAYEKKYLSGANQILDMFKKYIDFQALNTEWPSKKLVNSTQNLQWKMGYKDLDTEAERGTLNSVIGITSKDDESKLRGSRGVLYLIEEFGCHIKGTKVLMFDGSTKNVEDVVEGDVLMGDDNTPRVVQELYSGTDQLYKITLSNGDYQIVNSHHPVYFKKYDWNKHVYTEHTLTAPELMNIKDLNKGYYIPKATLKFEHKDVDINPYFLGLWLGDGDSTRLDVANKDPEVLDWLSSNYDGTIRDLKQSETCKVFHISKLKSEYNEPFIKYDLYNNKHIPNDYKINSSDIQLQVIAGLIDTDGTYNSEKNFFEITQRYDRKHILDDVKFMCECNGLKCHMSSRIGCGKKKDVLHYRLRISGDLSIIPTKISRKKGRNNTAYRSRNCWSDYTFKVEPYKVDEYYGFTVDKNHLFVLGDLTVTHNTFPRLLGLYSTMRPSVEDGDEVFGMIYMYGTAGDNDSDFAAAQEIMYNPKGYNMYPLRNVYDKEGQGRQLFVYFFPGYMNRAGCYDINGNSDVTKALLEILKDRYIVKYNSSDVNAITKRISEIPITPQEAILKSRGSKFPITELNERLNQLDNNPTEFDDVYVGKLVTNTSGEIEFTPTNDLPIRDFPLRDNKNAGAIEIYKLPEKGPSGRVMDDRYIIGHDPVDDDEANTSSLTSTFVFDLYTDRIVAEYTGRNTYADDNFEVVRKLCLFYNAKCLYENNKKGLYAYFKQMNCTYLLADTPEYLKDEDKIKTIGIGNKSKGVNASAPVNNYANDLIRDWLLKPYTQLKTLPVKKEDGREEMKEFEVTEFSLYTLRNRALIKELMLFSPDGNFDRIRALGMVMLYRQQFLILYGGDVKGGNENYNDEDDLSNDPFFTKNYDDKFTIF